jgi:hypothetical protein
MEYIEERAAMHPKGLSGYVRDLVLVDRAKWQDMEKLRAQALSKLNDNERAALGFPLANTSVSGPHPADDKPPKQTVNG